MEKAKFNIGDTVQVKHATGLTWVGTVYRRSINGHAESGEPVFEYWVTDAPEFKKGGNPPTHPLLAWEHEMTEFDEFLLGQ